ncbi:MAG: alpha-L-fucosidase [Bacteroidota bacterium]|nr:alpha-L-fucosidase [Bacteroidota bacterium]MDP4212956.1 alpha-L-fucosidase [Bacteroidota bacterium]
MKKILLCLVSILYLVSIALSQSPSAVGPVPSEMQQKWQDNNFYLFMHFGPNTFTDLEWGKGSEKEEVFNPTALDCRQWCRIAKAAGAKGIIITAKHHDGFCLWPSAYSHHTVAQSSWRNGKGDVLKELSQACKASGLSFGVYLSPWDRNHPAYGTPAYNDVFVNMMKEVVARYGPFFEFWWDGANGEGPNGKKQQYDWQRFISTMRTVAPNTPVFSDIGPDIRWAGNEEGHAGATNWNLLDTAGFRRGAGAPPGDTLNQGNVYGANWIPAECDVSIRPGWFYHKSEDSLVKKPEVLFDIYLKSIGRGANLILNVPPDRRGLITAYDSATLMEFAKLRRESFQSSLISGGKSKILLGKKEVTAALTDGNKNTWVSLGKDYKNSFLEVRFNKMQELNCIELKEPTRYGQRVKAFAIELWNGNQLLYHLSGTTIGHQRILSFPRQNASRITIKITDAKAEPLISSLGVYRLAVDNGELTMDIEMKG